MACTCDMEPQSADCSGVCRNVIILLYHEYVSFLNFKMHLEPLFCQNQLMPVVISQASNFMRGALRPW